MESRGILVLWDGEQTQQSNSSLHVYFDESIHLRGGFILGAYVVGDDAEEPVSEALRYCGLRPGLDEFKSSAKMSESAEQVRLRDELMGVLFLRNYRIGVLVAPVEQRVSLGEEAIAGLDQILGANSLLGKNRITVFFDQGIFRSAGHAEALRHARTLDCEVKAAQDSRLVKGIQLADLVAHTCATMLLETLGKITKIVKAGDHSGYLPEMEVHLGFKLWAGLRYQFFHGGPMEETSDHHRAMSVVRVAPYGLRVAESCSATLSEAAYRRFATCYLGCIH